MPKTKNHIVALSGGKDSTALALKLKERYPRTNFTYVCTPTGDELPEMFAHWRKLGKLLGKAIVPVMATWRDKESGKLTGGLTSLIRKENRTPSFRMRFCTRQLKIEPYRIWIAERAPAISYVGLRADEPGRAGGAYDDLLGIEMRFPLREWGWDEARVWQYLNERGVSVPRRTDCARCYHQRIGEWWMLWKYYPDIWDSAESDEALTGHTFRTPGRDTWPTALKDLRAEFEGGRTPKSIEKERNGKYREVGNCRVCTL